MISDKIKALFQFIDYLHSNIDYYKQFDEVIESAFALESERLSLKPQNNYKDKLKCDDIIQERNTKFNLIREKIAIPLEARASELNIISGKDDSDINWNGVESEIYELKRTFTTDDIPEIMEYKTKYLEFRIKTQYTYFKDFFFMELDEVLKELFDFFKDSNANEFEQFEAKRIKVNSFSEVIERIRNTNKGLTTYELPINQLLYSNETDNPQETDPYNNMFVVSPVKIYFQNRHTKEKIESHESANQPALYDVPNSNVYDAETGELIRIGTQTDYNSDFLLKLHHSYVQDVKPFLTYQYKGSANPEAFLDYVKFAALNDPIVEHESIKSAIRDWLSEQRTVNGSGAVNEDKACTFTNNFDSVNSAEVYQYFHDNLVMKNWLSESELQEYLIAAFEKKEPPQQLFRFKLLPTKSKVTRVFYEYYKNLAGKPHRKQKEYANLLGGYFLGYDTENVRTNFSK